MRALSLFILFSVSVFSQTISINNNQLTITQTGVTVATKLTLTASQIDFYYAHSDMVFGDSAVVITGGTDVQITNATDSLWSVLETYEITYLHGDTMYIDVHGSYNIFLSIGGSGNNTTDWKVSMKYKRAGIIYTSVNYYLFSTDGAGNYNGTSGLFYQHFEIGDKIWLVISRTGGAGDYTIRTSNLLIEQYYAR